MQTASGAQLLPAFLPIANHATLADLRLMNDKRPEKKIWQAEEWRQVFTLPQANIGTSIEQSLS